MSSFGDISDSSAGIGVGVVLSTLNGRGIFPPTKNTSYEIIL